MKKKLRGFYLILSSLLICFLHLPFAFGKRIDYSPEAYRYSVKITKTPEDSVAMISSFRSMYDSLHLGIAGLSKPAFELAQKGFKKIWLDPGQSQTVSFTITPELLSFYDKDMKWIIEPGDFTIMVGTSSDKTESIKLTVVK